MAGNIAFFFALLSTALALGGALAHALELPNKIGLPADEYFIVQKAYRGWHRLAFLLMIQLASMAALVFLFWNEMTVRWSTIAAIGCVLLAQLVFWAFTFPANKATSNWTRTPDNWRQLRRDWEYSHAAGALFQCLAMVGLIVAVLARQPL